MYKNVFRRHDRLSFKKSVGGWWVGRREANWGAWLKKIRLKLGLEEAVYRLLNVDPSWSHLRRKMQQAII